MFTPQNTTVRSLHRLDLAVLSACSTAQAYEDESPNLVGLSRDFLLAGTKAVVGNKWAADSNASELFMQAFYDALLLGGSSPQVALSQAQATLRSKKGFEHPFFWGAPSMLL